MDGHHVGLDFPNLLMEARIIHEARPKSPQDASCCVVATDSILDGVHGPDCGRIGPAALPDTPWNNLDSTFMNNPG